MLPLPGIDMEALYFVAYGGGWGGPATIFAMIAGGDIGTLFAMGIAPYITASIIMQLLTYAIPKLSEMQKDGEDGRKKIEQITRYLAVGLAAVQASAQVFMWTRLPIGDGTQSINLFRHANFFAYLIAVTAMIAGTIFIMWLAELLTERGVGNGASFLIFANILAAMPNDIATLYMAAINAENLILGWLQVGVMLIVFAAIIAFVVLVHEGERRIPVQYAKGAAAGRRSFGNQSSYIPLKVNIAGVLSIIFAVSLLQFPVQIAMFFPNSAALQTMRSFLDISHNIHWVGLSLYVILIFAFTHFYTSFAVNAVEMAENMKKNGGVIPGVRSGKPTSEYIQVTVDRLSWIGSVFYALIALIPILLQWITGWQLGFGGTTILIATGVALEFIKQLESQLLMRHYKGFLN